MQFSDVSVSRKSPFRPYYLVNFVATSSDGDSVRLFEMFKNEEQAQFWADALRRELWNPLETTATEEERARLEAQRQ